MFTQCHHNVAACAVFCYDPLVSSKKNLKCILKNTALSECWEYNYIMTCAICNIQYYYHYLCIIKMLAEMKLYTGYTKGGY